MVYYIVLSCFYTSFRIFSPSLLKGVYILFLYLIGLFFLNPQTISAEQHNLVRSVIIKVDQSYTQQQIRDLMQTDVGKRYDVEVLKKDVERITRFFHNKGRSYTRVREKPIMLDDGVYISIEIDEGRIGVMSVSGNTKTKDHVILRELLFQEGDIYIEADKKESERILRQKRYIGAAKIESKWDEYMQKVAIHVTVTEFFSLTGALDPGINNQTGYVLAQVRESNIFGSGQAGQVRYERISEVGEVPRGLITLKYRIPRLVSSHWDLDAEYIQERDGDSWRVLFERPQYTLKSRWSTRFGISELKNQVRWYEDGIKTDTFELTLHKALGNIVRYFGDRHHQNYIGLWMDSNRTKYETIQSNRESDASPLNRNINRVGVTMGRRNIGFHKTRFLHTMGGDEDFITGSQFHISLGHSSPIYGSDRTESYAGLGVDAGFVNQNRYFGTAEITFESSFTDRIERSILQARSAWFFRDVFKTGEIYRVDKGFRENGLFDFQQTFVLQYKTVMQFGLRGESQVILGSGNGLRGYSFRQFSGEKMMLLSIESRTLCGGDFFRQINNGLTKISTFIAKPFIRNRTVDLGLVLSVTAFMDIGYIWDGYNSFNIRDSKRSVGFGLRGSFSQVSDSGIFRFELAFPLDPPVTASIQPQLFYGVERVF